MHFSGCSASCAQPQIADIGFRGDIAHVDQHIEEAVDIGLGGSLGPDAAFIDWVTGAMPVSEVPDALVRVVGRYQAERRAKEPFHLWARRIPMAELTATVNGAPGGGQLVKRYRVREEMNGIAEPSGQGVVLGARGGRDPCGPLHRVRDLRRRVPVELHRRRPRHQPARVGQDVHRVLAVLGFLPSWRPALRGALATVDPAPGEEADVLPAQVRSDSSDTYWKITGGPPADGLGAVVESFAVRASARMEDVQDGGAVSALLIGSAGRRGDRRCAGVQTERRSRRAVERASPPSPRRPSRSAPRRAASTTRPWPWPSSTSPVTSSRPSRASPSSAHRARCRGSAPCRRGAGLPVPIGSMRSS